MVNTECVTMENADSPISVLEEKEQSASEVINSVKENDGSCNSEVGIITDDMETLEKRLAEKRTRKEEVERSKLNEDPQMDDLKYSKLESLLNQTQLYSEFLLERMDDITQISSENGGANESGEKKGRGRKRKSLAVSNGNNKKVKAAINAMISSKEDAQTEATDKLTEEERLMKEQSELVPLLTGGRLKSYQIKGVKWLISLWQNGLNGILADQMGLGKTVQTIGLLAHLKGMGLNGPFLIIAPLSTLSNWVSEITRFVPSMKALLYHGDKNTRNELRRKHMPASVGPDFPVVVTSYEIAMNDIKAFTGYSWKYVVVDEGHRLKNFDCKLLKELKKLPVENKLLLTGTPLQNNLAELWSLLNFILPQVFGSREEFESWFDLSGRQTNGLNKEEIEEKRRAQVISKLHLILRPFLLRRLKEEVEHTLPPKKEILLYATMTEHQKQIQDHLLAKSLDSFMQKKMGEGYLPKLKLNNLMIQLRKNCNHPDLLESQVDNSGLYPPVETLLQQCGKLGLLERLIKHLKTRKHKILLFSQWTKLLDILEYYLSERGYDVCRIDGSVKLEDRKRQIAEFNSTESEACIFLLSTRAGGLGINLTAADTVIIYDSDWNPQMDLQAMDRCHRIGQTRPVHVYRLVTAASVEGRMLKVAYGKLKLEHLVIEKGQFRQERVVNTLAESDLISLLKQEPDEEEQHYECEISEENLVRLLDRSDMLDPDEGGTANGDLPLKGPGWEVIVRSGHGESVLSSI